MASITSASFYWPEQATQPVPPPLPLPAPFLPPVPPTDQTQWEARGQEPVDAASQTRVANYITMEY